MNTHALKVLSVSLLAVALACPAAPAFAQHEGHTMPMPAAKPTPKKVTPKPTPKTAAGRPAASKPAAKAQASRPGSKATSRPAPKSSGSMQGMDHSNMEGMDHSTMEGMDHSAGGQQGKPDLAADAAPRTPIPALTDADRAAALPPEGHGHAVHDERVVSYWLVDRLEWQDTDEGSLAWEGVAWIGGDLNRVWLRTEGEATDGGVESANAEVLYGRSISPWWDAVAGVRQNFGRGPSRTYAAAGFQGLAPYKYEVEATAFVGANGRGGATLEAEYDTLITNRLILQWQGETTLYVKDDPAIGVGSGLSTIEAGARLRYEFSRRFAPYIGVEYERAFGRTADLRREDDESTRDTRLVAGIRFWF